MQKENLRRLSDILEDARNEFVLIADKFQQTMIELEFKYESYINRLQIDEIDNDLSNFDLNGFLAS